MSNRHFKTTGHIILALIGALWIYFPAVARAAEVRLSTSNDLISGGGGDDLYTAALELEVGDERGRVLVGERMFTDRERGARHDETYFQLGRDLPERWGWRTEVRVGLLRVGRGLAGEAVQNEIHRWVGAEPVHLEYRGRSDLYPSLELDAVRPLGRLGGFWLDGRLAAESAPGFRSSLDAQLGAERQLAGGVALRAAAGIRLDDVQTGRLAPHVDDAGWTAGLWVGWRRVALGWTRNDDGTGTDHLTLAVRVGGRGANGAGAPGE